MDPHNLRGPLHQSPPYLSSTTDLHRSLHAEEKEEWPEYPGGVNITYKGPDADSNYFPAQFSKVASLVVVFLLVMAAFALMGFSYNHRQREHRAMADMKLMELEKSNGISNGMSYMSNPMSERKRPSKKAGKEGEKAQGSRENYPGRDGLPWLWRGGVSTASSSLPRPLTHSVPLSRPFPAPPPPPRSSAKPASAPSPAPSRSAKPTKPPSRRKLTIDSPVEKGVVGTTVDAAVSSAVHRLSSAADDTPPPSMNARAGKKSQPAKDKEARERLFFEEQRATKEAEDQARKDEEAKMGPEERAKLEREKQVRSRRGSKDEGRVRGVNATEALRTSRAEEQSDVQRVHGHLPPRGSLRSSLSLSLSHR